MAKYGVYGLIWFLAKCNPFFIFFVMIFSTSASALLDLAGFSYHHHVIKPACIALFNSTVDRYPYVERVNLRYCQAGLTFFQTTHHKQDAYYFLRNNKDKSQGFYAYEVVGRTKDHLYVLHTYDSLDGVHVFDNLLLIALQIDELPIYRAATKPRWEPGLFAILKAYVVGGDRCMGGIAKASLQGGHLFVWKYPEKNSVTQCRGAQKLTIDLSELSHHTMALTKKDAYR